MKYNIQSVTFILDNAPKTLNPAQLLLLGSSIIHKNRFQCSRMMSKS